MAVCSVTLRTSLSSLRRKPREITSATSWGGGARCGAVPLQPWAAGGPSARWARPLRGRSAVCGVGDGRAAGGGAVSATCAAGAHLPSFPPLSFLKIDAVEVTSAHSKKKKKGEQIGKDHLFVLLEAAPHGCRRWPFSSWGCHPGGWPGPCGALSAVRHPRPLLCPPPRRPSLRPPLLRPPSLRSPRHRLPADECGAVVLASLQLAWGAVARQRHRLAAAAAAPAAPPAAAAAAAAAAATVAPGPRVPQQPPVSPGDPHTGSVGCLGGAGRGGPAGGVSGQPVRLQGAARPRAGLGDPP